MVILLIKALFCRNNINCNYNNLNLAKHISLIAVSYHHSPLSLTESGYTFSEAVGPNLCFIIFYITSNNSYGMNYLSPFFPLSFVKCKKNYISYELVFSRSSSSSNYFCGYDTTNKTLQSVIKIPSLLLTILSNVEINFSSHRHPDHSLSHCNKSGRLRI